MLEIIEHFFYFHVQFGHCILAADCDEIEQAFTAVSILGYAVRVGYDVSEIDLTRLQG